MKTIRQDMRSKKTDITPFIPTMKLKYLRPGSTPEALSNYLDVRVLIACGIIKSSWLDCVLLSFVAPLSGHWFTTKAIASGWPTFF